MFQVKLGCHMAFWKKYCWAGRVIWYSKWVLFFWNYYNVGDLGTPTSRKSILNFHIFDFLFNAFPLKLLKSEVCLSMYVLLVDIKHLRINTKLYSLKKYLFHKGRLQITAVAFAAIFENSNSKLVFSCNPGQNIWQN